MKNKSEEYYPWCFMTEYFIDREKYFYLILLHTDAAVFIGLAVLTGGTVMILTYYIYACGMLSVAR